MGAASPRKGKGKGRDILVSPASPAAEDAASNRRRSSRKKPSDATLSQQRMARIDEDESDNAEEDEDDGLTVQDALVLHNNSLQDSGSGRVEYEQQQHHQGLHDSLQLAVIRARRRAQMSHVRVRSIRSGLRLLTANSRPRVH